jgi:flagellar basal-body rod protein FlgB
MQLTTPMTEALSRYLDLTTAQIKLTASNMANIDTPAYRTQGFDFQRELASQLSAIDPDDATIIEPQAEAVDGLVARPDGNNVSMDREGLQLAKSQLQFRLGVQLLKSEFSMISSAIHSGDGK